MVEYNWRSVELMLVTKNINVGILTVKRKNKVIYKFVVIMI